MINVDDVLNDIRKVIDTIVKTREKISDRELNDIYNRYIDHFGALELYFEGWKEKDLRSFDIVISRRSKLIAVRMMLVEPVRLKTFEFNDETDFRNIKVGDIIDQFFGDENVYQKLLREYYHTVYHLENELKHYLEKHRAEELIPLINLVRELKNKLERHGVKWL